MYREESAQGQQPCEGRRATAAADIIAAAMNRLARFAWAVLAFTLAVILSGAYVRATGSGAGCGGHWPLCNGELIPRAPSVQTLIEYSHRVTSALALLAVLALLIAAWRSRPPGDPTRAAALASGLLMMTEAALGAALVLFPPMVETESVPRALLLAAHLVNSFLILATLALTAHWAAGRPALELRGRRRQGWMFGGALAGLLVVGVSGAVAALGDTLHPSTTLPQALAQDLSPAAQLLPRLRLLHPLLAVATGTYLLMLGLRLRRTSRDREIRNGARRVILLVFAQVLVGLANVGLLAPIWLQMAHLLLADLVWIAAVMLAAALLAAATEPASARPGPDFPPVRGL